MSKETRPKFVIGIGSQRAGSTLLHHLLSISTEIFMHPLKELHYFDTLFGIRPRSVLTEFSLSQIAREIDNIIESEKFDFLNNYYKCYLRTNRLLGMLPIEKINYLDLYGPCIAGRELLGEITPEYMLLPEDAILKMQGEIGSDAVIILLCRDPVDRILSTVKLENAYNNLGFQGEQAEIWLRSNIETNSEWMRAQDGYNNYKDAIARYSKYFEKILAINYESLIKTPQKIAKLLEKEISTPINVDQFSKGAQEIHNSLGEEFNFSPDILDTLRNRYAESTEFISANKQ